MKKLVASGDIRSVTLGRMRLIPVDALRDLLGATNAP
jgi:hypothetical protein